MVQAQSEKRIKIISGEKWYGAAVNEGEKMPFKEGYAINLNGDTKGNQAAPLTFINERKIYLEQFSFCI